MIGMPSVASLLASGEISSRSTLRPAFSSVSAKVSLLGLAALGLAEDAPNHRLVARLQALRQHRLGRQGSARIKINAGITKVSFRPELILQIRQRRVAGGDDDALINGLILDEGHGMRLSRGDP